MQSFVYIKTFDESGDYVADWTDITKYVANMGKISIDTDSSDFQIGVYKTSNVSLDLVNREGLFADVGMPQSLFKYKRADSKIKITYTKAPTIDQPLCGTAICGSDYLSDEVTVFEGLIDDTNFYEDITKETGKFSVLGFDTLFSRVNVDTSVVSIGDSITDVIFAILNQTVITDYLSVVIGNINPDIDQNLDAVDWMENTLVRDALDSLLLASNSVLYIRDAIVYVSNRDPTASVIATYHGQASASGAENIHTLGKVSNGFQRMFNYMSWSNTGDTAPVAAYQDNTSVVKYGIVSNNIQLDAFTNSTKQIALLTGLVSEFKDQKQEMEITTTLDYEELDLQLLDRIGIDYPTIYTPSSSYPFPICGIAICGEAILPKGIWTFSIPADREFKILRLDYDLVKFTTTLKLRQV
jgi:hypothetical protein